MGIFDIFKSKQKQAAEQAEMNDLFKEMEAMVKESARKEGTTLDELPNRKGDFGLDINNPIPVKSIEESYAYLDQLQFEGMGLKESLNYSRLGSGAAEGLKLPVDIYKVENQQGESRTIYVWPYNKVTSKKVPAGFNFK